MEWFAHPCKKGITITIFFLFHKTWFKYNSEEKKLDDNIEKNLRGFRNVFGNRLEKTFPYSNKMKYFCPLGSIPKCYILFHSFHLLSKI